MGNPTRSVDGPTTHSRQQTRNHPIRQFEINIAESLPYKPADLPHPPPPSIHPPISTDPTNPEYPSSTPPNLIKARLNNKQSGYLFAGVYQDKEPVPSGQATHRCVPFHEGTKYIILLKYHGTTETITTTLPIRNHTTKEHPPPLLPPRPRKMNPIPLPPLYLPKPVP
ncbi:hypothetical protein BO71DRAFT_149437 [Aspergillus ellipticus CBS 707.79]|uniref:Uncharacterized protein n=1 Tax=Aspergillus ellipticus CBS 707.79 TaxID=1448320 RepID=A0A319DSL5_9EURO|nr:hypothetical protein BO71DRAFT_149437 [Aspergillus ellipticus CBS 707.79]